MIAFTALVVSVVLAGEIGLIDLIAKGYGTLTWVFMLVFIAPLLTVGLVKVYRGREARFSDHNDNEAVNTLEKPLTTAVEVNRS